MIHLFEIDKNQNLILVYSSTTVDSMVVRAVRDKNPCLAEALVNTDPPNELELRKVHTLKDHYIFNDEQY